MDECNLFGDFNYLEVYNCFLEIKNVPINILKDSNNENNLNKLNTVLDIFYLLKDKINNKLIINIIFDKEELPNEISFYQYFLLSLYSFLNIYYSNNQLIIIKFPQIFKNSKTPNFNLSINLNLSTNLISINTKTINYKNKNNINLLENLKIILSQIDESLLLKNNKLFEYNYTCFAGTFDRCHLGHLFLIQTSLLLSKNNCFIGVCSDEMIKHKGSFSLLQKNYVRRKKIEEIINLNGYNNNKFEVKTIFDSVDMAGNEKSLNCLIVTSETYKGGLYCNEIRKKNNLNPVDLCIINVIKINLENSEKISSSFIRNDIINMIPINKLDKVYFIFLDLIKKLNCDNDDLISFWWNEIEENYCKKWKFYHNLNHIYSFIELYEQYNNLIEGNKNDFLLSIFFHDIIYIPSRNDNEKESVKLFERFYEEIKPNNINKDNVKEFIYETENHLLAKEYSNDINLFLDMDIYIIADKNWEEYENNIRKEFIFVNDEMYKIKRKEFLESLEKKEKIFRTKTFYDKYENDGRNNIKNIINKLNNI